MLYLKRLSNFYELFVVQFDIFRDCFELEFEFIFEEWCEKYIFMFFLIGEVAGVGE